MFDRSSKIARVSARRMPAAGLCSLGLAMTVAATVQIAAFAGDWPTYRHDNSRSGVATESLKPPFVECWRRQPRHAPEPAWGDPNPRPVGGWYGLTEQRRVHFDDAYHVTAAGGAVYFGSSADGKVYSLDAKTGKPRWTAFTGGPVRLAPTLWQDKVYVGSDDGFVYCLQASDGREVWKFRAAPEDRKVLGSGKMISLWPVRTGVVIDDGTAYFGAGIFPAEGVFMYAVDAQDGTLVWCNDSCGAAPQSRISPQGYLLASKTNLFAPLGRVPPAVFDRKDGRLRDQAYIEHIIGGTFATLAGDELFTGTEQLIGYDQQSHRSRSAWFWGRRLIATPKIFYVATGGELFAVDRQTYPAASLRRKNLLKPKRDLGKSLAGAKKNQKTREAELKRLQQAKADKKRLAAAEQALAIAMKNTDGLLAQTAELNQQIAVAEGEMAAGEKWRVASDCAESLILAGDVILAGGNRRVVAYDAASGDVLWTGKIDGKARGLTVADGRLLVSSDTGDIYCFGEKGAAASEVAERPDDESPFPRDEMTAVYEAAAEHIVKTTGIKRGYCLVLGCGTGRLVSELAKRTELEFCAIEPDREKAQASRKSLDAAGIYGARVLIVDGDFSQVPFSDYFANLVVSEEAILSGRIPGNAQEAFRMLKPVGGTICIGQPAAAKGKGKPLQAETVRRWLGDAGISGGRVSEEDGVWLGFRRGPLPGAGSWTHQYANAGNTACSDDQLVRGPLGLLWFGDPGPNQMADRHRRAAAPLSINGRFFVLGEGSANRIGAGENSVTAYDAYNGIKLWERKIRGALRVSVTHDAGNSAVNDDSLFLAVGSECWRLDTATGETKFTYKMPAAAHGKPRPWGYVAVVGDVLYGTRTAAARTADCVFAIDLASGRLLWKHEVKGIAQGSIAVGDGRLFFASADVTDEQRRRAMADRKQAGDDKPTASAVHLVVAVDAVTGRKLWEKPVEFTGIRGGAYWCSVGAVYSRDVLVLFGVFLDGHYWRQFFAGQFESRRVVALSGGEGRSLWQKHIGYRVRPLVIGDTLHAEPWAYDLRTGKQQTRIHPVTGREEMWQFARPGHHCGAPAASPHMLLFRSLTLGWYDLYGDYGTQHFGGQRPGCWINFIPANGLLVVPEASAGCMCAFPNACTVVFQNRQQNRQWAYFSQPGPLTPVKRLALNLGAPGDRKDASDELWLGYPRPGGSLVMPLKAGVSLFPGGSYFVHDQAKLKIDNTDKPWVFQTGARGVRRCTLPLVEPADGKARYTVRLAFAELDHETAGKRVFDIKLQGKVVAKNFDVVKEAGGKNKPIIKEFKGIDTDETLTVEFVPRTAKPGPDELPILQGIEVDREQVLSLGLAVPSFLLDNAKPEQTGQVVIANYKAEDFAGTLRIDSPDGFTVTPAEVAVKVPSGRKTTVTLKAVVAKKGPIGKYPIGVKLLRADGTAECEQEAKLDYLGNRSRVVLKAVEDTFAIGSSPTTNYGTHGNVNVDGGDRKLGDRSHSIGYLRFRIAVKGKPISAVLRLHNAGNPTGDSGRIRVVAEPWSEKTVTYQARPKLGDVVGKVGPVTEKQVVDIPLKLSLEGLEELSLAIDPTGCDGVNYLSREAGKPAELIVECVE